MRRNHYSLLSFYILKKSYSRFWLLDKQSMSKKKGRDVEIGPTYTTALPTDTYTNIYNR